MKFTITNKCECGKTMVMAKFYVDGINVCPVCNADFSKYSASPRFCYDAIMKRHNSDSDKIELIAYEVAK